MDDNCFLLVREPTVRGIALCFGTLGYAEHIVRNPADAGADRWVNTVRAVGYNITHAVSEAFGAKIDPAWALHTRGFVMAPITSFAVTVALCAFFARRATISTYVFACLTTMITVIIEWAVFAGVRGELRAQASGLDISPLGSILFMQLSASLALMLCFPFAWFWREIQLELAVRQGSVVRYPASPPIDSVELAPTPPPPQPGALSSSSALPIVRCTPSPPVSPPSTPSPPPSPLSRRTTELEVRRQRHTWRDAHLTYDEWKAKVDAETQAEREAVCKADEAAERERVRQHPDAWRTIEPEPFVPEYGRYEPAKPDNEITPPKTRVERWRQSALESAAAADPFRDEEETPQTPKTPIAQSAHN